MSNVLSPIEEPLLVENNLPQFLYIMSLILIIDLRHHDSCKFYSRFVQFSLIYVCVPPTVYVHPYLKTVSITDKCNSCLTIDYRFLRPLNTSREDLAMSLILLNVSRTFTRDPRRTFAEGYRH